jgi:hypothetical protein
MNDRIPYVIAVCGFSSNVGKTTLVCDLLEQLPGWEAIKLTRGHFRSCGKDPHSCCVSDLLSDEPVVRSGRSENYESGKDTGRFWDAGAVNVHWVIASDEQVEPGIKLALERVTAPGVIVEGNSFLRFIEADLALMCARAEGGTVKSSARASLTVCDSIYLSQNGSGEPDRETFRTFLTGHPSLTVAHSLPLITHSDLPTLVKNILTEMKKRNASGLCLKSHT